MGSPNEMVYIVDDDTTVCDALSSLLCANGKNVRALFSGAEFLSFERRDAGAFLILDLRMPGMDGLEVQKLISNQASIPVIFITGRGDVPSTVKAMKGGAVDFLIKPIDETALLPAVKHALEKDSIARCDALEHADLLPLYHSLTPEEREVLPLLVSGMLNKQVA